MSLASLEPMVYSHWPQHNQLVFSLWGHRNWQLIWGNGYYSQFFPHTFLWIQSEVLIFIWFKSTVDPTWKHGSPQWMSASNSTWDRYLSSARCCVPMTAVQKVPIPLVARQMFSKTDKNSFGDVNPHGPASWVKKKNGLMQKCWLLGTEYLRHHVSEKYQHTKLIWNYFIFSSTYVFFPVC